MEKVAVAIPAVTNNGDRVGARHGAQSFMINTRAREAQAERGCLNIGAWQRYWLPRWRTWTP
jgi:hypothetical protein